jgi:DNA adenine methylase
MEKAVPASNNVQPFLKWAGSKRQLIPVLSRFWNEKYQRYVEPFAGSACLFFNINPKSALLGDINEDLINTYNEVKKDVPQLLAEIKKLKKSKDDFYRIRAIDISTLSPVEKAARFIYLNRYCFNGLYRTNSQGKFNVPYCGDQRGNMPDDSVFIKCSNILQKATLIAGKFDEVLKLVKKGDFVYMDPPYSVRSNDIFNEYDRSKFSPDDIRLIRKWMVQLHKKKIPFLVSYAESDEANFLSEGFKSESVSVRRSIAGFASNRRRVNEVLIYNT